MVTFYTRERGLVEAAAQGVGKPGSSLAPAVELFTLSKLFLVESRGADRLTQARVIEPFFPLRNDMTRYGYAAVACELIMRTTEVGQTVPGLFDMLVSYLRAMQTSSNPRVLSWAFEVAYLELGGIGPVLDRCAECADERPGGVYLASHGGVVCEHCAPASATASAVSAGTVRTLQAMRRFDLDRLERLRVADASKRQIAALLRAHISYHLDVGLRSEKFVEGLESWRRSAPRRSDSDAPGDDGSDQ